MKLKCMKAFVLILLVQSLINARIGEEFSTAYITDEKLFSLLDRSNSDISPIVSLFDNGDKEQALSDLAGYFRDKMSSSYFFDWKKFRRRFEEYAEKFPDKLKDHIRRKNEHLSLYPANTGWKLPMTGLDGTEISPYLIRHLARQHKMMDIAFCYYIENGNKEYLEYFTEQVESLYEAYLKDEYEKGGNDVFEYYRAGYRVFNWLFVYNMFLASEEYTVDDQIMLIKTFLYHGADLYKKSKKYHSGNHHTKGLTGLAQISILFSEFGITGEWLNHALSQLTMHLENEINSDGFQFERSMHYHIGDIENYFYVYYLAQINNVELPEEFVNKFRSMFDAIVKVAMPNKKLPVLQDDTDSPWAEYNNLESPMFLGVLLFNDPVYKYFSGNKIPQDKFWFVRESDAGKIKETDKKKPAVLSVSLDETGYYVMRKSWDKNDNYMIISAGLSNKKPDHQHGDMLGVYAYANKQVILPNYQVRYFLEDYRFFKNSFVKNVAIVDSIPQGRDWKGNRGGSGFGKFKELPEPETLLWKSEDDYDLFIGSHNGYKNEGVEYRRKVLFVKDGFWIVKDVFVSGGHHNYQQIWQGHFNAEADARHIRTTFPDGSGLDIYQMNENDYDFRKGSFRGKGNSVISINDASQTDFITLVSPFSHFEERLISEKNHFINLKGWDNYKSGKIQFEANKVLSKGNSYIAFDVKEFKLNGHPVRFDQKIDILIKHAAGSVELTSFNEENHTLNFSDEIVILQDDGQEFAGKYLIKPGEKIIIYSQ